MVTLRLQQTQKYWLISTWWNDGKQTITNYTDLASSMWNNARKCYVIMQERNKKKNQGKLYGKKLLPRLFKMASNIMGDNMQLIGNMLRILELLQMMSWNTIENSVFLIAYGHQREDQISSLICSLKLRIEPQSKKSDILEARLIISRKLIPGGYIQTLKGTQKW